MAYLTVILISTLVLTSLIGLDAKVLLRKRTKTTTTVEATTRITTDTKAPNKRGITAEDVEGASGKCKDWEQAGAYSCSFVCGLNDQWYPEDIWGTRIPGARHCQEPGKIVASQCPYYCIDGEWFLGPCKSCCHDYSENQCEFTCDLGLEIRGECDPFNGTLPEVVHLQHESNKKKNDHGPECNEGDTNGSHTCSFICGLNQQWYPKIRGGETPEEADKCTEKGSIVAGECPSVCIEGQWRMKSCAHCCEDYQTNQCGIACEGYLFLEEGCDPFNPSNTTGVSSPSP